MCSERATNSVPGRQFLRIAVNLLIDLYVETRMKKIRDFILEIQGKIASDHEFNDRVSRIISILEEEGTHGKDKSPAQTQ
jgi:hypothetical protein